MIPLIFISKLDAYAILHDHISPLFTLLVKNKKRLQYRSIRFVKATMGPFPYCRCFLGLLGIHRKPGLFLCSRSHDLCCPLQDKIEYRHIRLLCHLWMKVRLRVLMSCAWKDMPCIPSWVQKFYFYPDSWQAQILFCRHPPSSSHRQEILYHVYFVRVSQNI